MNFRLPGALMIRLLLPSLLFLLPAFMAAQNEVDQMGDRPKRTIWLFGPTVMVGWNNHTGQLDPAESLLCGAADNGSAWGFGAGVSAEWLPSARNWSLLARLTYEERPGGSFSEIPAEPLSPSDPENPEGRTTWMEISYSLLNAEVLFKREVLVFNDLRIALGAGPAFQYVLAGNVRQGYETDSSAGICYDGEIPDLNPLRFSLKAGVQGEIPLFDNEWIITPGIYYDYGLTNVEASESWQVNSVMFQIDVRTVLR